MEEIEKKSAKIIYRPGMFGSYEILKKALIDAKKAANFAWQEDDGGTCNFDSPTIRYKEMKMKRSKVVAIIESLGMSCFQWLDSLVISGCTSGMGNRRTAMAEAFSKKLNDLGISSGVYYQMD